MYFDLNVSKSGPHVELKLDNHEVTKINNVIESVIKNGVIISISLEESLLEDVFIKVTSEIVL